MATRKQSLEQAEGTTSPLPTTWRLLGLAAGVAVAFNCGVVLWASQRGVDFTDEGLGLVMMSDPQRYLISPFGYHHLVGWIVELFEPSVPMLRMTRLMSLLVSHGVLVLGARRWLRARTGLSDYQRRVLEFMVPAAALTVAFARFTWTPLMISYNDIAADLAAVVCGMCLWDLAEYLRGNLQHRRSVAMIVIGAALGLLLVSKWVAGISMYLLVVMTYLTALGSAFGRKIATLVTATLATLGLIQVTVVDLRDLMRGTLDAQNFLSAGSHTLGGVLAKYLASLVIAGGFLIGILLAASGLTALVYQILNRFTGLAERKIDALSPVMFAIIVGLGLWLLGSFEGGSVYVDEASVAWMKIALLGPLAWIIQSRHDLRWSRPELATGLLLFGSPFAIAIGTNNRILYNASFLIATWVVLVLITWAAPTQRSTRAWRWLSVTSLILLGIVGLSTPRSLYGGIVERPYRQAVPLTENDAPSSLARLRGVRLNKQLEQELARLMLLLGEDRKDTIIIQLVDRPLLVYLSGGKAIGFPWYPRSDPDQIAADLAIGCKRSPLRRGTFIILIQRNDRTPQSIKKALRSCGLELSTFRETGRRPLDGDDLIVSEGVVHS